RGRLGGEPNILGSSIMLDKRAFTVIGVMRAGFRSPGIQSNQDIWVTTVNDSLFGGWMERRGGHWLPVMGRLEPGVTLAPAQTEMEAITARLAKEYPAENEGWTAQVIPLQKELVGDVRPALLVLLAAVGLVLLIACANIANLLLARATSRTKEMGLRLALGAGRGRIIRQLLTESAALGVLGGIAGILLAYWGVQGLSSLLPPETFDATAIHVDGYVLAFALLLSIASSFAFGLAPAILATGSDLNSTLREGSVRASAGAKRLNAKAILAGAEIALAMVLLIGA